MIVQYTVTKSHSDKKDWEVRNDAGNELLLLYKSDDEVQVAATYRKSKKNKRIIMGYRVYFKRVIYDIRYKFLKKRELELIERQLDNKVDMLVELDKNYLDYDTTVYEYISDLERLKFNNEVYVPVIPISKQVSLTWLLSYAKSGGEMRVDYVVGRDVRKVFSLEFLAKAVEYSKTSTNAITEAFDYMIENRKSLFEMYSEFYCKGIYKLTRERAESEYYKCLSYFEYECEADDNEYI